MKRAFLFAAFALPLAWCGRDGTRLSAQAPPSQQFAFQYLELCDGTVPLNPPRPMFSWSENHELQYLSCIRLGSARPEYMGQEDPPVEWRAYLTQETVRAEALAEWLTHHPDARDWIAAQ